MKDSLSPGDSYKILVEWARHHNERLSFFNNTNMLIHGAIVTAIGYLVYDKNSLLGLDRNNVLILALSLFGIITAWFWRRGLLRMRIETNVRFGQLRALERIMGLNLEQQIFTEGYRFFFPEEAGVDASLEEVKEVKNKPKKPEMQWEGLGLLDRFKTVLMKLRILKIEERDLSLLDAFMNLLWVLVFVYSIIIILFFIASLYVLVKRIC